MWCIVSGVVYFFEVGILYIWAAIGALVPKLGVGAPRGPRKEASEAVGNIVNIRCNFLDSSVF